MPRHTIPDVVKTILCSPKELRAAEIALERFTIPSTVSKSDVKGLAAAIRNAGTHLNVKIVHSAALNAASHITVGKPWQKAEKELPQKSAPFTISLSVLGGDHRAQHFPMTSVGEMVEAAIDHVLKQAPGSRGAIVDIQRSPYSLILTTIDRDRPTFVIECHGPFTPGDQSRFTYRFVEDLGKRAPTILVNNALLPMSPKLKPYTQAFFQLNAVEGTFRSGRLVGELELFEQFARFRTQEIEEAVTGTVMSVIGAVRLQAGFRTFDEPFPRDYVTVTAPQLAHLMPRYTRWTDAVGSDVAEVIAVLKQRRRSVPLNAPRVALDPGQAVTSVHVPARLPMIEALGSDFFDALIGRNRLAALSRSVRSATLTEVPGHVAAMKVRIEVAHPGYLKRLNRNQHSESWPMPRQMLGLWDIDDVAGLGYWEHAQEVAGPTGRFAAADYAKRIADLDLTNALKRAAVKTTMPCPECSQQADIAVTMVPTDTLLGVWSLVCNNCGHNEAVTDAPDRPLALNAAPLTCNCNSCIELGQQLLDTFGTKAADFPRLMDKALMDGVDQVTSNAPGWALTSERVVHFGEGLSGQYIEIPMAAAGDTAPSSLYQLLPAGMRERLPDGPIVSARLAQDFGFKREILYCALPPFDGSAGWEHTYSMSRAGFDPQDLLSFRRWAQNTLAFALAGTLVLPVLVTVSKPPDLASVAA